MTKAEDTHLSKVNKLVAWLNDKKKFIFIGNDYVVVAMSYDEYFREFPERKRHFDNYIIEDTRDLRPRLSTNHTSA